jgi:hypothetical protein
MVGLELGHRVEGNISDYHSAISGLSKISYKTFPNIPNPTNVEQIIWIQPRKFVRVATHTQDWQQV